MNQRERILKQCKEKHTIDGRNYIGSNPVFRNMNPPHLPASFKMVTKGIPFVRV